MSDFNQMAPPPGQFQLSPEQPHPAFLGSSPPLNQTGLKRKRGRPEIANVNVDPNKRQKTGPGIGAMGQAVWGFGAGNQICPICRFQATTKNPYRHLQDHLARTHFKDRLARDLPQTKPFYCPTQECKGKIFHDWEAVMGHYSFIGVASSQLSQSEHTINWYKDNPHKGGGASRL